MKMEQTNRPDPQLRQQLDAKSKKFDEAFNNNDAAAAAAFFTEDGVLVSSVTFIESWTKHTTRTTLPQWPRFLRRKGFL